MSIVGVGVDVVTVSRFAAVLDRTPAVATRLFTDAERAGHDAASLAARFAAKEAVVKALGTRTGLRWRDTRVEGDPAGRPAIALHGSNAETARRGGVARWHLSLSHDGDTAVAVVVAER